MFAGGTTGKGQLKRGLIGYADAIYYFIYYSLKDDNDKDTKFKESFSENYCKKFGSNIRGSTIDQNASDCVNGKHSVKKKETFTNDWPNHLKQYLVKTNRSALTSDTALKEILSYMLDFLTTNCSSTAGNLINFLTGIQGAAPSKAAINAASGIVMDIVRAEIENSAKNAWSSRARRGRERPTTWRKS